MNPLVLISQKIQAVADKYGWFGNNLTRRHPSTSIISISISSHQLTPQNPATETRDNL
jgi:hypothetical protein